MTRNEFRENSANWYLGAHQDAKTTKDINEAKELYEERISFLEAYVKVLEADLALLKAEETLGMIDGFKVEGAANGI